MSEKFCLKWNDFHSNVSKSFTQVRNEEYLHDVTLVSDDHKKFSAHRLVLSACSEYFRDIFKNYLHSHPLVCLDGFYSEDLQNIMDYIYNGEIQIYQDNLDRFLVLAQKLKLQGLIENNPKIEEEELKDCNINEEVTEANEKEQNIAKYRNGLPKTTPKETHEGTTTVAISNMDQQEIKDKISEYLIECSDKSYKCALCGKISFKNSKNTQKDNMKKHIETHLEGLAYTCPICQKECKSRNALALHKGKYHT